jgi:predicted transcriptional regulator
VPAALDRRALRLGELERAVLDQLWRAGPADVRGMHRAVGAARGLALNTIQSTLERLFRKGLAERAKRGRAFEYRARVSRAEWTARWLEVVRDTLPGGDAGLLLAAFVDLAARAGEESLAELVRLVRARRAEREAGE